MTGHNQQAYCCANSWLADTTWWVLPAYSILNVGASKVIWETADVSGYTPLIMNTGKPTKQHWQRSVHFMTFVLQHQLTAWQFGTHSSLDTFSMSCMMMLRSVLAVGDGLVDIMRTAAATSAAAARLRSRAGKPM